MALNTCDKHKKDFLGACNWCGKKSCEFCIQRTEGKKIYCEKCVPLIGSIRREPRPIMAPPVGVPSGPAPAKGRKFVLQDGYLVIDGGM